MAGNVAADLVVHVGSDVQGAVSGLNQVDQKVTGLGSKFQIAGGMFLGAGAAMAGGLGLSISTAANFEQAMANIGAVSGLAGAELDKYGDLALEIGSKTSFGATEGAMAIEELVKAGLPMEDILNGAAMGAANMAEAGGIAMPDAAKTMSNAMNMFKIAGEDATKVADVFAGAANASAADMSDLSQALSQGGPSAAAFGISLEDTVGALALFSNYGITGSDAGTSMKTMLASLTPTTEEAKNALDAMGFSMDDFINAANPLEYLAGTLETGLADMTVAQRAATLETIFGSDAQRVANILYEEGAVGVANMNKKIAESPKASEMAATRLNTLKGSIESLKGAFETAMIIVGSMFIPGIRAVADSIGGAVVAFSNLSPNVQKFIGIAVAVTAAFFLLVGAIMMVSGYLLPMIGAFTAIASPILLVVAALAALYIAYKTNFMGFADGVNAAISGIMGVLKPFLALIKAAATGDVMALGNAFKSIPGPLKAFAALLAQVITGARAFFQVMGKDGIGAAFAALPRILSTIAPFFNHFVQDTLGQLRNIPWGAMFDGLLDAGKDAGKMVTKLFKKIPWEKSAKAGLKVLQNFGSWVLEAAGDAGSAISDWWSENLGGVDWMGPIRSGLGKIANLWGVLQPRLAALPGQFHAWWTGWLNSVPWNELGVLAGEAVRNLAIMIGQGLAGIGGWLAENWQTVITVITGLMLALPGAIAYMGATLIPKAIEFLQGFLEGLGVSWPGILSWLQSLPGKLLSGVASLISTLAPKAWELIQGLWQGLVDNWPTITSWLGEMGGKVLSAVGSFLLTLAGKGLELITSLYNGLINNWPTISSWLASVGGMILTAVGSFLLTLAGKGAELISGLITAIVANWPAVSSWLADMGGKILTAVGSFLLTLAGKGAELISGLITAVVANWPAVSAWMADMGPKILAAVGSFLLTLAGKGAELISGLITAVVANWPAVSAWMADMGPKILLAVGSFLYTLAAKGAELMLGLITALVANWPAVVVWLSGIAALIPPAVGSLLSTLAAKGAELILGFITAIVANWPAVATFLTDIKNKAVTAVGDLGSTLLQKGKDLLKGMENGVTAGWDIIYNNLTRVGASAVTAVGNLASTLLQKGKDLLKGMENGVTAGWNLIYTNLTRVGSSAATAVGNLGGVLVQAGKDLMNGLSAGIDAAWEGVKSKLNWVTDQLPDWKGPPAKDKKLLKPSGIMIMDGLNSGLDEGWHATQSQLRAYTKVLSSVGMISPRTQFNNGKSAMQSLGNGLASEMAKIDKMMQSFSESLTVSSPWLVPLASDIYSAPGAQLPSGGVSVEPGRAMASTGNQSTTVNHFQVDVRVDELEDMVRAGNFVKNLNSSRKLYS